MSGSTITFVASSMMLPNTSPLQTSGSSCVLVSSAPMSVLSTTTASVYNSFTPLKPRPQVASPSDPQPLPKGKSKNPSSSSRKKKTPPPPAALNPKPTSVCRRNARERNRVRQVNMGFASLRQHLPLPCVKGNKKVSKVETLKAAVDYIRDLQEILAEHDAMYSPSSDLKPSLSADSCSSTTSLDVFKADGIYSAQDIKPFLMDSCGVGDMFKSDKNLIGAVSPFDSCYTPSSAGFTPLTPMSDMTTDCAQSPMSTSTSTPSPSSSSNNLNGSSQGSPYDPIHGSPASTHHYAGDLSTCQQYPEAELSIGDEELLDVISWWQQSQ